MAGKGTLLSPFNHPDRYLGKKKLVVGLTESVPEMKKPKFKGLL
jgi:hypothetical protein